MQLDTISAAEQPELINDLPETVHLATVSRINVAEVSDDISDTILTRNSSWDLSIRVAKFIINSIHVLVDALRSKSCKSYSNRSCISYEDAKNFLLLGAQRKSYGKFLIGSIQQKEGSCHFPGTNHLAGLAPFIDAVGLIRVGGRLKNADVPFDERFPVLLPAKHPISTLVIRYYHEKTRHQGRHLTLGAIRSAGYHIEKSSKAIKNFIGNCVVHAASYAFPYFNRKCQIYLQKDCNKVPRLLTLPWMYSDIFWCTTVQSPLGALNARKNYGRYCSHAWYPEQYISSRYRLLIRVACETRFKDLWRFVGSRSISEATKEVTS